MCTDTRSACAPSSSQPRSLDLNFHSSRTLLKSLCTATNGFAIYTQRSPCGLELSLLSFSNASGIDVHFGQFTVFIVLSSLRVLLVVNEWYALHEHYYFRNLSVIQRRYRKRMFPSAAVSPSIIHAPWIDPRSVFVITSKRDKDLCITENTTFYTLM